MFLATTAINSFWDINKKIIFLGPWCLISRKVHIWKNLEYEIMTSPWLDRDAYYEAGKYSYKVYHYLLDVLTDYLNSTHRTKYSKRFWQIIIGPWLLHFTESFYDRYCCSKKAFREYSPIKTILLDEGCFITPQNTKNFMDLYCDDFYNLQLYSQIIKQLGIDFSSKKAHHHSPVDTKTKNIKFFIKNWLYWTSKYVACKRPVILWDMYLNYSLIAKYVLVSKFLSFPVLYGNDFQTNYPKITDDKRLNLAHLPPHDEFTRILIRSLPINFPTLYLEGFNDFLKKSLSAITGNPKILLSSIGWYSNEKMKFLAAYWAEQGTVLCGFQHGGLYCTAKWMPPENHEIEIVDKYFIWGGSIRKKVSVKYLPNPKISNLMYKRRKGDNSHRYLFVGTNYPRYLYRFFSVPAGGILDEYVEWRNIFLENLSQKNRKNILIRLYHHDYEQCQKDKIIKKFPDICFDNHKDHFLDRLEKSQITIIDHPVTTMLESLARNRPTILFWNPNYWEVREEAKPFFEGLADAGIWYKDPQSAAQALNKISNDPLSWWHDSKTQSAKKKFINKFALGQQNWTKIWVAEMNEILKFIK